MIDKMKIVPAELKLPDYYKENNPSILQQVRDDMENARAFHYLFIGSVGCGKTELARAIANSHPGFNVVRTRRFYRSYLEYISMSRNDKYESIRIIERQFRQKLLVLDDLGDEKPSTSAARDYMSSMIEERYDYCSLPQNRGKCRTIITTNLSGKEILDHYGSRVLDRIEEMFIIMKFKKHSFRHDKVKQIFG